MLLSQISWLCSSTFAASGLLNKNVHVPFGIPPLRHIARGGPSTSSSYVLQQHPKGEEGKERNEDDKEEEEWESEMLDQFSPPLYIDRRGKPRREARTELSRVPLDDSIGDWAENARSRALAALRARNPRAADYLMKKFDLQGSKIKKPKKKKKKQMEERIPSYERLKLTKVKEKVEEVDNYAMSSIGTVLAKNGARYWEGLGKNDITGLLMGHERIDTQSFASRLVKDNDEQNQREKALNRRLTEVESAEEVLSVVFEAEDRSQALGGLPSPLSPINAATALHRIAKHMEASQMAKMERLSFSRKRHMAELVGRTMDMLEDCSAQGLANIAWSLSKIGGSTLFTLEMDHIADHALPKLPDFNPQNVANIAGAFASMQHSTPVLFSSLATHASQILRSFKVQELAQVLWSFAVLCQPAGPLLDALDQIIKSSHISSGEHMMMSSSEGSELGKLIGVNAEELNNPTSTSSFEMDAETFSDPFNAVKIDHLANISWSFAVLNEVARPSFKVIWQRLESLVCSCLADDKKSACVPNFWHFSQIHQVNLCLQYEYPQLELFLTTHLKDLATRAWEEHKRSLQVSSAYEKDLEWLLGSYGKKWVKGYASADYSLDLAVVDDKMALEFDGPSHFARNTGQPLGHTVLKRRLLTKAGWKVFPISYTEWEKLDGEMEQRQYLDCLLNGEPWQHDIDCNFTKN